MRYFAELSYNGTNYVGWQSQPNGIAVQAKIEEALSTILREDIAIVGCGRTDAGVHAKKYFIHFDTTNTTTSIEDTLTHRINKFLPKDIAFKRFIPVKDQAHARFDATNRGYEYHIEYYKNPLKTDTAYFYPFAHQLDMKLLQESAKLLIDYDEFFPFCKTNSDAKTMCCDIRECRWTLDEVEDHLVFHIAADRFLRGMVRLIVGMCLNVALYKMPLEEVKAAMDNQTRLEKSLSVPAHGLYLSKVEYPFI